MTTQTNLKVWNVVSHPPPSALKSIGAGRLKGKTDINPQWRLQVMTEQFGQIGVGWYYNVIRLWTENGANGELMCFVHIQLFTKGENGNWSQPIEGIGGSGLVDKESGGLRANDEGYKMALTDSLSVAMKQIGIASAIYEGLWDGSKYKEIKKAESVPPIYGDKNPINSTGLDYSISLSAATTREQLANAWAAIPTHIKKDYKPLKEQLKTKFMNQTDWNKLIIDAQDGQSLDAIFDSMNEAEQATWFDTIEDKKSKIWDAE